MDLIITVKEINGHCPTYKVGGAFPLKAGYQRVSNFPVCMHGRAALMPYYNALRVSEPAQWGLGGQGRQDQGLHTLSGPLRIYTRRDSNL